MSMVLDTINEGYYLQTPNGKPNMLRERVHWICARASGRTVLDIGCSQGITCILLGREGKNVVGIDVAQASIDYALDALSAENEDTKRRVSFECADLFGFSADVKFDTVIMAEVLEHLVNPTEAVEIAGNLMAPDGRFICSVPFGINDWIDHKKTYYAFELFRLLESRFEIQDFALVGKWLVTVCGLRNKDSGRVDFNVHAEAFEGYFRQIERDYVISQAGMKESIQVFKEENHEHKKEISKLRDQLEEQHMRSFQEKIRQIEMVAEQKRARKDYEAKLYALDERFSKELKDKQGKITALEIELAESERTRGPQEQDEPPVLQQEICQQYEQHDLQKTLLEKEQIAEESERDIQRLRNDRSKLEDALSAKDAEYAQLKARYESAQGEIAEKTSAITEHTQNLLHERMRANDLTRKLEEIRRKYGAGNMMTAGADDGH